jgi:Mg/Co/Ni transporter MgtE
MDVEDAADILEEMEPDEAADLLADLSAEHAENLLEAMAAEEAADVRELLQYQENTAGGIMSTEYIALAPSLTVSEALARLRSDDVPEFVYYLYVVDEGKTLLGVLSLRSLLMSAPEQLVTDAMNTAGAPITARVTDPARDVAEEMVHYNLLAMPVLDDEGRLAGIVQMHDALERLLPDDSRRRFFGAAL